MFVKSVLRWVVVPQRISRTSGRSYHQYCAVARGLEVIGDRWTLLMIRDLLLGAKRYKDLIEGLPGIGTNLLAHRLRELEALGVVERAVLPPPAGSSVYQLTEVGRALEPVVATIGRWGARFLGPVRATDRLVPSAFFFALRGAFRPELAAGMAEAFELHVAGRVFEVRIEDDRCLTREGQAKDPDVVMSMSVQTLNALLFEGLSPRDALASHRVEVQGHPMALDRFVKVFSFSAPR
jgi:DNA-binding HxlR family transcriptional regulator/putative sterol carrier protein